MYDLAPRFSNRNISGTPNTVAPNTYIICYERGGQFENAIPFLSSTKRKMNLGKTLYTESIYTSDDTTVRRRIVGGSTLRNKAIRLTYPKGDTPGPTDYDPKKIEKGCKYKPPPRHGKGRKYVCRVPYTIFPSAPSVPTHVDENGYDIDVEGNLVKCPPNVHDRSIGPAFYKVPRGELCFTTRKYHKGCQWSKSQTKRMSVKVSDTPAPGDYDPKLDPYGKNPTDEEFRSLARYLSFLPRFTESEMCRISREGIPGPGAYNVDISSFQCPKTLSINPRPFIVGAGRFSSKNDSDIPGPGTYEVGSDAEMKQKLCCAKHCAPFGSRSERLRYEKSSDLPGPASYSIIGPLQEKLRSKINKYAWVEVPFCQTAERKMGFVSPEAEFLPGPGEYDVDAPEVEEKDVTSYVFKSGTTRFRAPRSKEDGGPASYNVSEQFKKNYNRTSHHTGKVPFLSSISLGRTSASLPRRKTESPGPADYMGPRKTEPKGLKFNDSPRFKYSDNGCPGPGSYSVHPSVGLSIYKAIGTHNLRLKENVFRCKFRQSPNVTWEKWAADLKKKKKLQCFAHFSETDETQETEKFVTDM